MKKHYPWLWFDADGTLFDYDRAEGIALRKTFQVLGLRYEDRYLDVYRRVNAELWRAFERQEVTQAVLRERRFELMLQAVELDGSPELWSNTYIEQLAACTDLLDGALEVLKALHRSCRIAILTNGLQAVQRGRLARSSIKEYISEMIVSEEIGTAKPHRSFFETAFARTGNPAESEVLMIGDSLTSDIKGAADCGIDTCWYNPEGLPRPKGLPVTYEIGHLRELMELVQ